jgi:hypothetical protein
MFDKIAFTLPRYQRWFDICRKNTDSRDEDRLVQSLAFIYADIIEFALQAYRMFSRLKRSKYLHCIWPFLLISNSWKMD